MEEVLKRILPQNVLAVCASLDYKKLFEIRLRAGRFASVNYGGKNYFLSPNGLCALEANALKVCAKVVHDTVVRATDYSLYAVNDQLKNGYITIKGGVRLGIAGEVVSECGVVKTIKNYSSVNIRIPHEVLGCSDTIYNKCFASGLNSTLIISPPAAGKTTILRDLARKLGGGSASYNVLLVDERSELSAQYGGVSVLNVGASTDIIANAPKSFAFSAGLRTLAPDVIITDELMGESDAMAASVATASGIAVVASVHGKDVSDIKSKNGLASLVNRGTFTRFVEVSTKNGPGTIIAIKDGDLNLLWT